MKIYLAATFQEKDNIKKYIPILQQQGHISTASWLNLTISDDTNTNFNIKKEGAYQCLNEIDNSDCVIMFNIDTKNHNKPKVRGGRHFELGYALAKNKICVIIGHREHIFHYLDEIPVFDTIEEALTYAESIYKIKRKINFILKLIFYIKKKYFHIKSKYE